MNQYILYFFGYLVAGTFSCLIGYCYLGAKKGELVTSQSGYWWGVRGMVKYDGNNARKQATLGIGMSLFVLIIVFVISKVFLFNHLIIRGTLALAVILAGLLLSPFLYKSVIKKYRRLHSEI